MKLTIKTLENITFQLHIVPSETVWDLKLRLYQIPKFGIPPERQNLIYSGRKMDENMKLDQYAIDERRFIVVTVAKEALPGARQKKRNNTALTVPETTEQQQQDFWTRCVADTLLRLKQMKTLAADEQLVKDIVGMGYPELEVRHTLRLSFNNAILAVEFLNTGIPAFKFAFSDCKVAKAKYKCRTGENALAFLRFDSTFARMRSFLHERPEMLPTILLDIAETNPALLSLIRAHQAGFVQLLQEDHSTLRSCLAHPKLTRDDELAVKRLMGMGFSRAVVTEAYMSSQKNETKAQDHLYHQMVEEFEV